MFVLGIDTSTEEALADSLQRCRDTVMGLTIPDELQEELKTVMKRSGMYTPETEQDWEVAYQALRGVWASKVGWRRTGSLCEDFFHEHLQP